MALETAIETTVVGSYPKYPKLVGEEFDVRWLVSPGEKLDAAWSGKGGLEALQKEAMKWALQEQEEAGVDVISDGEQRRGNFVLYHCQHLGGFDFSDKRKKWVRGGSRSELVPTIKWEVKRKEGFLAKEFEFAQSLTKKKVKATLPGPLTIIDSVMDLHYGNEVEVGRAISAALNEEIRELAAAGCKVVQLDEPAFIREPGKFFEYGIRGVQECFRGIEGVEKLVHVCRGYPSKEKDVKAEKENYSAIVRALSKTCVDGISIEDAHEHNPLSLFSEFGEKKVVLGCVDIGEFGVESVEEIEKRLREVLEVVPAQKLCAAPDCGLLLLSPQVAKAKLTNMVRAVEIVKADYL